MKKFFPFVLILAAGCSGSQNITPAQKTSVARVEAPMNAAQFRAKHCFGPGTPCEPTYPKPLPLRAKGVKGFASSAIDASLQGFGQGVTGGAGGTVCTATNHATSGAGSFSDCARRGNVIVQFSDAGPFTVDGQQTYIQSNTTIDGCANGQNGVTLDQKSDIYRAIVFEGGPGGSSAGPGNVLIRCIRFQGVPKVKGGADNEHDLFAVDGTGGPVSGFMLDRCTFVSATDGAADLTGDVSNVTIQNSLFYSNGLTQLIKYAGPSGLLPRNISLHHNVYVANGERNPQVRGAGLVDLVSNVVGPSAAIVDAENNATFDQFGHLFWNSTNASEESTGNVKANVRASQFTGSFSTGPNGAGTTGVAVITDSGANSNGIYLAPDNVCTAGPCMTSPTNTPNPVPAINQVTATPVASLKAYILSSVGSPNKTSADVAMLNSAASAMTGGGPTPTPIPTLSPTPTPNPTGTPTPVPTGTPTPRPTTTPTPVATPTPKPTPTPGPTPKPPTAFTIISNTCGDRFVATVQADGSTKVVIKNGPRCEVVVR